MHYHKKILVAMELISEKENFIVNRAKELARKGKVDMYIVHAIEQVGNYAASYAVSAGIDIEKTLSDEARKDIKQIAQKLEVSDAHQIIKIGLASQVILEVAKEIKPDLIIVGSHGKHGLGLLLGSTANSVIHSAKCDVLAVRAPI